jgi:hypothetical protein
MTDIATINPEDTTDDPLTNPPAAAAEPAKPAKAKRRLLKIGDQLIVAAGDMAAMSLEQLKQRLAQSGYPEAANATTTTSTNTDGDEVITFLPVAGRKG